MSEPHSQLVTDLVALRRQIREQHGPQYEANNWRNVTSHVEATLIWRGLWLGLAKGWRNRGRSLHQPMRQPVPRDGFGTIPRH